MKLKNHPKITDPYIVFYKRVNLILSNLWIFLFVSCNFIL